MAKKTPNEKRDEANRDEAKDHLREAIKKLTGKDVDDEAAADAIAKASALLEANQALAVGDGAN